MNVRGCCPVHNELAAQCTMGIGKYEHRQYGERVPLAVGGTVILLHPLFLW